METDKDLEQKIKDEIEIGFKKLNFALRSYNKDFEALSSVAYNPGNNEVDVIYQLIGPAGIMFTYRFKDLYEAYDKLTEFKKEAINICSHQKKERH